MKKIFLILMICLVAVLFGMVIFIINEKQENIQSLEIESHINLDDFKDNYQDSINIINSARDVAKKWQLDASPYGFSVISDGNLQINQREVVFNSDANNKERFKVFLQDGQIINTETENKSEELNIGYINYEKIKISSFDALKKCIQLAEEKNINPSDFEKDFMLSPFKSLDTDGRRLILTERGSYNFIPKFECIVDARSGNFINE